MLKDFYLKLSLVALAISLLYAGNLFDSLVISASPQASLTIRGNFAANAYYPSPHLEKFGGVRTWASWTGNDDNEGQLMLEGIHLSRRLTFLVCGNPSHPGNQLYIEDPSTGDRLAVEAPESGLRWVPATIAIPEDWVGRSVRVVASDQASGPGGWLGLSEPVAGWTFIGFSFLRSLGAACIVLIVLGGLTKAVTAGVERAAVTDPNLSMILTVAIIAVWGLFVLWAYFLYRNLGWLLSCMTVAGGGLLWLRRWQRWRAR